MNWWRDHRYPRAELNEPRRQELRLMVEDYSAHGGTVQRVPEERFAIDWSEMSPARLQAREMAERGHARRWGRRQ